MKIGFIVPRDAHNLNPFRLAPISVLYLSTIIEDFFGDKIELEIIDLRGVKKEFVKYYLPQKDVYFYSVNTPQYLESCEALYLLKEVYPTSKHIAGGFHTRLYPEESLKIFDAIAIGEGERIIIDIINDLLLHQLKKVYKETELININNYPFPRRDFLPKTSLIDTELFAGKYASNLATGILLSKGCPYQCAFCANLFPSKPRCRTPELITQEIEYLKREYQITSLVMKDDTMISINKQDAIKTLTAIGKSNIIWRGNSRANNISEDLVKLTSESGCVELALGIESAEQRVLDIVNKKLNLQKAKEFICLLKKYNINPRINFVIGLPGESKNIVQNTIEFIKSVEPYGVLLSFFTPIPGSEIFTNPQKFGIQLNKNLDFGKLFHLFNRFDDKEKIENVYTYSKISPLGESLSIEQIAENYLIIQDFLKQSNLNY